MIEEFDEPKKITEGMKQGLARMYSDTYMRQYLDNAIAIAKNNAITLIKAGNLEGAKDYVSRSISLEQLREKGRENFINFEKIKNEKKHETS